MELLEGMVILDRKEREVFLEHLVYLEMQKKEDQDLRVHQVPKAFRGEMAFLDDQDYQVSLAIHMH